MKRMNVGEVEKKCWIFSMDKIAADLMGKSMWQTLQQQIIGELAAGSREL